MLSPFHFGSTKLDKLRMPVPALFFEPVFRNDAVIVSKPILDTPLSIAGLSTLA
jgi:hypothetical protein